MPNFNRFDRIRAPHSVKRWQWATLAGIVGIDVVLVAVALAEGRL